MKTLFFSLKLSEKQNRAKSKKGRFIIRGLLRAAPRRLLHRFFKEFTFTLKKVNTSIWIIFTYRKRWECSWNYCNQMNNVEPTYWPRHNTDRAFLHLLACLPLGFELVMELMVCSIYYMKLALYNLSIKVILYLTRVNQYTFSDKNHLQFSKF